MWVSTENRVVMTNATYLTTAPKALSSFHQDLTSLYKGDKTMIDLEAVASSSYNRDHHSSYNRDETMNCLDISPSYRETKNGAAGTSLAAPLDSPQAALEMPLIFLVMVGTIFQL